MRECCAPEADLASYWRDETAGCRPSRQHPAVVMIDGGAQKRRWSAADLLLLRLASLVLARRCFLACSLLGTAFLCALGRALSCGFLLGAALGGFPGRRPRCFAALC